MRMQLQARGEGLPPINTMPMSEDSSLWKWLEREGYTNIMNVAIKDEGRSSAPAKSRPATASTRSRRVVTRRPRA